MTPVRRFISMALGAITILLLGFVVAVAARSRPGNSTDDPLFEIDTRVDLDLGRFFAWIIIVMAVIGAVLFALGLQQSKPRPNQRKRSYLGLILGVIAFFLIFRYVRPLADSLLNPEAVDAGEETIDQVAPGSSGSSGWLFSLLLAAIVAAALTRVGIAVRDGDPTLEPEVAIVAPSSPHDTSSKLSVALQTGTDSRSRIFRAYYRFEESAGEKGVGRQPTETASRHATRAIREMGLDPKDVSRLVGLYARARFGFGTQTKSMAAEAERLSDSAVQGMRS